MEIIVFSFLIIRLLVGWLVRTNGGHVEVDGFFKNQTWFIV
jgi:hypothetical protein